MVERALVWRLGDIEVLDDWAVTPSGLIPMQDSVWEDRFDLVLDRHLPWWAVAGMILFLPFFGLGLVFLFFREDRYVGWAYIRVIGTTGVEHEAQIPISSRAGLTAVEAGLKAARTQSGYVTRRPPPDWRDGSGRG